MPKSKLPPSPICILRGHGDVVTALHFTNEVDDTITEKPSLISGSITGEIFIWSLKTERTYHRFKYHDGKMILYLCYYKSSLLSQGRDGYIHESKLINNEWSIIRSFNSSIYLFCASFLFPTESKTYLIAPTEQQSSVTFYDYDTSAVLKTWEHNKLKDKTKNTSEMCMCMKVFTSDIKMYLLMGYDNGFLSLWDYESNKEISQLKCHPNVVLCLDYDFRHRNRGISGSVDDALEVWKMDEHEQLVKIRNIKITNPGINAVKIRSDGKIAITAGQDKSIRVFSWKNLKPLAVLMSHRSQVSSLAWCDESFGKYNSIFASGSKDKNICVSSIY